MKDSWGVWGDRAVPVKGHLTCHFPYLSARGNFKHGTGTGPKVTSSPRILWLAPGMIAMMISKEARNTSEGQPNIAHLDEFLGPCKKIENYFIVSSDLKRDSRREQPLNEWTQIRQPHIWKQIRQTNIYCGSLMMDWKSFQTQNISERSNNKEQQ